MSTVSHPHSSAARSYKSRCCFAGSEILLTPYAVSLGKDLFFLYLAATTFPNCCRPTCFFTTTVKASLFCDTRYGTFCFVRKNSVSTIFPDVWSLASSWSLVLIELELKAKFFLSRQRSTARVLNANVRLPCLFLTYLLRTGITWHSGVENVDAPENMFAIEELVSRLQQTYSVLGMNVLIQVMFSRFQFLTPKTKCALPNAQLLQHQPSAKA